MNANLLALFWEGFEVESYTHPYPQSVLIRLQPAEDCQPCCSGCHQHTLAIHDTHVRRIRERDETSFSTESGWKSLCVECGVSLAALGLNRFAGYRAVSVEPDRRQIRRLVMDEFALFKGHRYATVVINADNQQVLWVGEGNSREAIRAFFEWLGSEACASIEAVAMDMNTAMDREVQHHCSQARVVYDPFHVVAKFGREVIDRVRVDQANQLRHDKPARKIVKRSRWLLLRNRANLKGEQTLKLEELLQANQPLMTVYLLKDQLKELWFAPSEEEARQRWQDWLSLAISSGLAPVQQLAKRLKGYVDGIVASATYRMNTSVLEGMNNKIKVIKRMAYGYRDNDYFFLKIKAAFPGKVR